MHSIISEQKYLDDVVKAVDGEMLTYATSRANRKERFVYDRPISTVTETLSYLLAFFSTFSLPNPRVPVTADLSFGNA